MNNVTQCRTVLREWLSHQRGYSRTKKALRKQPGATSEQSNTFAGWTVATTTKGEMMMTNISRKMANVADLPHGYLQLFAEDTPNLEDTPEFLEDAKEFNAKMDKFVEERQSKIEPAKEPEKTEKESVQADEVAKPEVVEPEKPKQDPETNKAFQDMRQKLEAQEARAKKADELIAKQWGESHGIFTVEQYEARLEQIREKEDTERYKEAGLTDEEIRKLKDYDQIKQESETEKQAREEQENTSAWQKLYNAYPDIAESSQAFTEGKEPEWFTEEMKVEIARGASPIAAYRHAHFESILEKKLSSAKETAQQEALDKLNSKDHLAPNATTGGEVDHVEIDDEQMNMYRKLTGKSDAEIRKWHKKNTS